MPKVTISATKRKLQFPNEGFSVTSNKLWCNYCSTQVDFLKKSSVSQHVATAGHRKTKEAGLQQPSVVNTINPVQGNQVNKWEKMVYAFTNAGIPIHVFKNDLVREWISQNVRMELGEKLPSESTLRRLLPSISANDTKLTLDLCENEDVVVVIDESQDIKNRKIVNTLINASGSRKKPRLVHSKIVDRCSADMIVETLLETLEEMKVKRSNLIGLITDNAPYMTAAARRIKAVCPRLTHSTCWAHVLHLQAEEVRSSHKVLDRFIACVKGSLVKAPARRQALQDCLLEAGKSVKLPPVPVITRWGTWLNAVEYHWCNFNEVKCWINKEVEDSACIKELKELLENENLAIEMKRIAKISTDLCVCIKQMEARETAASNVWSILQTIATLLEQEGISSLKLKSYLNGRHPSTSFWIDAQKLDPNRATIMNYIPEGLAVFSVEEVPRRELACYNTILRDTNREVSSDPFCFWRMASTDMPVFSKLALKALAFPASSADVERSFSVLNQILRADRTSFTETSLDIHIRLAYNQHTSEILQEEEEV